MLTIIIAFFEVFCFLGDLIIMFRSTFLLILSPQSVNRQLPQQIVFVSFGFFPSLQCSAALYYNTIKVNKSVAKTAQVERDVSQNAHLLLQYRRT